MVSNPLIQQQQSLSSKTLGLAMDSQYIYSGQGHVLFSGILSYLNSYSLGFLPPLFLIIKLLQQIGGEGIGDLNLPFPHKMTKQCH